MDGDSLKVRISARWARMLKKPHCSCTVDEDGHTTYCGFHQINTNDIELKRLYYGRALHKKLQDEEFMREAL